MKDIEKFNEIKEHAIERHIPIIMDDTLNVIEERLRARRTNRILEIGTAVGYSAICFSEFLEPNGIIDTIERDEERIKEAKENIKIIDNNKRNPLDDIAKLLNIVTRDIIEKDREKSKAVISITMVNATSECAKFVASTIITNSVDNNRDQIEYNARHLVNSVYYDAYAKLNMYRGDEDYLSHYMKEEWKEDIYSDIINIVYNKNLDSNQRILAFNKRIDIRVNDYTAYIINKAFK